MTTEVGQDFGFEASESLAAAQYCAVYVHTDGKIKIAGTAASNVLGICQDNAAQNKSTIVRVSGISKARILTSCTAGDPLKVGDSVGRLTTGTVGTHPIVGIALESASATDTIISVFLARLSLS